MIEVIGLSKQFDGTVALQELTLRLPRGGICGLVGSNGSGKSTLLRHIAGIYRPDAGSITIEGQDVRDNVTTKLQVFFLPDTPAFFRHGTVEEMAGFYEKLYPNFSRKRLEELGKIFPLDTGRRVEQMSKGMQRQAALMLALATQPRVLLLDEAFDGLDPVVRGELKQLLLAAGEEGVTTVIASHNLRELEDLCDHVTLLHNGRVICSGNLEQLRGSLHKVQAAYRIMPTEEELARLQVLKLQRTGMLLQMVIRGNSDEILATLEKTEPLFLETIQPALEEIFIYEMEVQGYDIKAVL